MLQRSLGRAALLGLAVPTRCLLVSDASVLRRAARGAAGPLRDQTWESVPSDKWWLGPGRRAKLIFWAGVEGAGHPFMQAMWRTGFPEGQERVVPLPGGWQCGKMWTSDGIQAMEASLRRLGEREVWSLPFESYPECGLSNHTQRLLHAHPRLDYVVHAAHSAGVELHVIFLHRSLEDILEEDCLWQQHEPCGPQAETLRSNAVFLAAQLRKLRPDMVSCFNFTSARAMEREVRRTYGSSPVADALVDELFDETVPVKLFSKGQWRKDAEMVEDPHRELDSICQVVPQLGLNDLHSLLETATNTLHVQGPMGIPAAPAPVDSMRPVGNEALTSSRAEDRPSVASGDSPSDDLLRTLGSINASVKPAPGSGDFPVPDPAGKARG